MSQMLKISQVIAETSLSRRTIYRLISRGQFPRSRKLSPQRVAWSAEDIEAWQRGCPINDGGPCGGPNPQDN